MVPSDNVSAVDIGIRKKSDDKLDSLGQGQLPGDSHVSKEKSIVTATPDVFRAKDAMQASAAWYNNADGKYYSSNMGRVNINEFVEEPVIM